MPPALPPKENPHRDTSSALLAEQNSAAMQQQHHQQQQQQQQADPGLASTPGSPLPPGTPGTGIPKPTAHVKGQTKAAPPERTGPTTPTSSPNVNTPHQAKDYNKMVRHQSSSSTPKGNSSSGAPRTASTPAGGDVNCPQEQRDPKGSLPRQKQLGRREDPVTGISVALVSPMPIPREKDHLVTPSESGSNISESSQSNSGHSNSTSSGNSSVIYKPTSSEDDSVNDYKMGRVSDG